MDLWKFYDIGHRDHVFCNPMSDAKFDQVIDLMKLTPGDRILDIACGKAEFLLRMARRWDCSGVGVDLSPPFVSEARAQIAQAGFAETLEIVEADGSDYPAPPEAFRASVCLGASWIWRGYAGMVRAISAWAAPAGYVLLGEPFWRRPPSAEHLKASGHKADSCDTHAGNVRTGIEQGLTLLHSSVSNEDDWDDYQARQWNAMERYAIEHPDDPDVPELLAAMRSFRDHYLSWGRDELGWAIYLFWKPELPKPNA